MNWKSMKMNLNSLSQDTDTRNREDKLGWNQNTSKSWNAKDEKLLQMGSAYIVWFVYKLLS